MKKRRLASGRWQIDYTRQVRADGRKRIKRFRESFDSPRDADLRILELRRRKLSGQPATDNEVEVQYCFSRWRAFLESSTNHSDTYRARVDYAWLQLSRHMPATLRQVTPTALDDYVALRSKAVKPATIRNEFRTLTACLNWCETRGVCVNPIRRYLPPRVNHQPEPVTSPEDLQAIFDHLRSEDARKAFWFILATGLRFSEFASLKADALTPGNTLRTVGKGTHGTPRERHIVMPALPFKLPSKGLLFTLRGRRWADQTLLDNIQSACDAAGVKRITVHHLRHCAATYKLAGGMNLFELMQHFGWRSFGIAQRYVDISRTVKDGNYLPKWPAG